MITLDMDVLDDDTTCDTVFFSLIFFHVPTDALLLFLAESVPKV